VALKTEAEAIAEGARYAGLEDNQQGFVRRYLHAPPREWMLCCDSSCDPCVMTIRRGVDRARELLALPPLED
jgi:hypothetical protein